MKYSFSKHALEQMDARSIPREWVEKVMDKPDQVINQGDLIVFQSKVQSEASEFLLRVYMNHLVEPALIVTVYKTSKISKYYENQI